MLRLSRSSDSQTVYDGLAVSELWHTSIFGFAVQWQRGACLLTCSAVLWIDMLGRLHRGPLKASDHVWNLPTSDGGLHSRTGVGRLRGALLRTMYAQVNELW